MNTIETQTKVRNYLVENFLGGTEAETLQNEDDLLLLLDSLQLLRMVIALEAMFAMKIEQNELNVENLGSVQRIAAFVASKCGQRRSVASAV